MQTWKDFIAQKNIDAAKLPPTIQKSIAEWESTFAQYEKLGAGANNPNIGETKKAEYAASAQIMQSKVSSLDDKIVKQLKNRDAFMANVAGKGKNKAGRPAGSVAKPQAAPAAPATPQQTAAEGGVANEEQSWAGWVVGGILTAALGFLGYRWWKKNN